MTSEISCAIPSNGVDWSGGKVSECQKVLQKGALQGQRILAPGLQVEDVELVTGYELQ